MSQTICKCLHALEVDPHDLAQCGDVEQEFSTIKRAYMKRVLVSHPDKGGDAALFRQVHSSFEVLRKLYENKAVIGSFLSNNFSVRVDETTWRNASNVPTQSWEFFYEAAEQLDPLYRVESARSSRSSCKQRGSSKKCLKGFEHIEKGEIRIGSMNGDTGRYTWWTHLKCWRVPSKIWRGLPNPETCNDAIAFENALATMNEVLLCGFNELKDEHKQQILQHVMEKDENGSMVNWARLHQRRRTPNYATAVRQADGIVPSNTSEVAPSDYYLKREHFVIPVPGTGAAQGGSLNGKTVVLTGIFPEVGGGSGLSLGKEKVKRMVESFGGRVTSSVSGKTDILIVGKAPGASKVSQAEARPNCRLISLKDLKELVEGGTLEDIGQRPMLITSFSEGYQYGKLVKDSITATRKMALIGEGYRVSKDKLITVHDVHRQQPSMMTAKATAASRKSQRLNISAVVEMKDSRVISSKRGMKALQVQTVELSCLSGRGAKRTKVKAEMSITSIGTTTRSRAVSK